jgi:hypothetical protein
MQKKGYESVRSILPIPAWETTKHDRQAASTNETISEENLAMMVQEMKRRNCKGIGGIHWDEMTIKEGIVLCKRTGKLVGFENDYINNDFNLDPEDIPDNENEFPCDSSSSSDSDSSVSSSDSELEQEIGYKYQQKSNKAKLICQFFFSSMEGDFSWPVATFPLHRINHKVLSKLVWQVCEALGNLRLDIDNRVQVLFGVTDGSTYSHVFFCRAGAQNWVTYNPYNDDKPIWYKPI